MNPCVDKVTRFARNCALSLLVVSALAACGGGGSAGSAAPQPTSPQPTVPQPTATATMQAGTVAVDSAEIGTTVTASSNSAGQRVLTMQNAGTKLATAQVGQVIVFEASSAMPLGFAGIVQSVQTTSVAGVPTTTATFTPAAIGNVFQNLNLNMSNVATNPQLMAGVALQNGVRAYTKTEPQVAGGVLGTIQAGLIEFNVVAKNTSTAVGVDFSSGIKATFWKVNGKWVGTDPGVPLTPKVDIVFTGQIELANPNFSQANIVIENSKLVTHNLQLQGTLKRNIKAVVTGTFATNAGDLAELFSGATSGFYGGNSGYNEYTFDYKGSSIKIRGVEKSPSKIILGAAIISAAGVVPTYGNGQTGAVLKTVPVGMVITFFMTADMQVQATASLGYQWRDMDINAGMGFSYNDNLGLPISLVTGNTRPPVPFWNSTPYLIQPEGVSYDVSGSASATLTAGFDGGIVLAGLELSQATVEGGIRASLSGEFSKLVGQAQPTGCYSSASVTAGVRALLDVAANVDLQTNLKSNWLKWLNTSVSTGYVFEFPMYPAAGVDWLGETSIWSVGDDTCHNPQFSVIAGTALSSYGFDATSTGYQPLASSFSWNFGDGATASGVTASHVYDTPGNYTVTLTVLFSDGIQKTISKTITVASVPALSPVFTVGINSLQASFDASTSTPSASITGYSWSFGDGATANGVTALHTYAAYSNTPWSVTLTVTDSYGRTASTSHNISANCPTGQVLLNGQCTIPSIAPAAPTGVSSTAGDGQATITWNAVTGVTSYNLYMASVTGVTKSNYSSLTGGSKTVGVTSPKIQINLTNGTIYYFVVTAVNASGESAESSQVTATPQSAATTTPGIVSKIVAGRTNVSGDIAVSSNDVYWADGGTTANNYTFTLNKAPLNGGVVTALATIVGYPMGIAVDATSVYWAEQIGTVKKVSNSGGTVTTLASGLTTIWGMATDLNNIYWTETGYVKKVSKNGGTVATLASAIGPADKITVDSTNVYWTGNGGGMGSGTVKKVSINGGTVITLVASGLNQPAGIVVDSTNAYWTQFDGGVKKISINGGTVTTLVSGQSSSASGIAVDSTYVYFKNDSPMGVKKVGINGGTITTLATSTWYGQPAGISINASSLFYTEPDAVKSVGK